MLPASREVTFAPLPEREPAVTVPEKVGLVGNEPLDIVPLRLLAVVANIA